MTEHGPIDFELYLPRTWTDNDKRRKEAGSPKEVVFKTKIELAADMLDRAVAAEILSFDFLGLYHPLGQRPRRGEGMVARTASPLPARTLLACNEPVATMQCAAIIDVLDIIATVDHAHLRDAKTLADRCTAMLSKLMRR